MFVLLVEGVVGQPNGYSKRGLQTIYELLVRRLLVDDVCTLEDTRNVFQKFRKPGSYCGLYIRIIEFIRFTNACNGPTLVVRSGMRGVFCCRPCRLPQNTLVDVPVKELLDSSTTSLRPSIFHALRVVRGGSVFLPRQLNLAGQHHNPVTILDSQVSPFRRICRLTFTVSITEWQILVSFEQQIDPLSNIAGKLPLVQSPISRTRLTVC